MVSIGAVILVAGGIFWFNTQPSAKPASKVSPTESVSPSTSGVEATTESVTITNFSFSPSSLTVKAGTTVTWTNQDSASHTVTGDTTGPASGTLDKGATYSYTFSTPGTYPYHCAFHPNMRGTITVTQ